MRFAEQLVDIVSRVAAANLDEALPQLLAPLPALCDCVVAALATPVGRRVSLTAVGDAAVVAALNQLTREVGDAVVVQTLRADAPITCDDVATERRWRAYTQALTAHTPIRAVQAHPLHSNEEPVVLVVYATQPGHFTTAMTAQIGLLARMTSALLTQLQPRRELEHAAIALRSCREISQALGILMATHKITSDQAFDRLRVASQKSHIKLRDVASEVTTTGRLPSLTELAQQRPHSRS